MQIIISITMVITGNVVPVIAAASSGNDGIGVAQVSGGFTHTGILKKDGSLWMTGDNEYGQLGDGTLVDKSSPVKIMVNEEPSSTDALEVLKEAEAKVKPKDKDNPQNSKSDNNTSLKSKADNVNKVYRIKGNMYSVLSAKDKTAMIIKAANKKNVTVPGAVKISSKKYKVTRISTKAFTGKKIRTVTVGRNVNKMMKNAFAKSPAKKVIIKTKN